VVPPLLGFALGDGDGERLHFAGADFLVKASGETTGGAICVIEEIDPLDTRLHVHQREDELFHVVEGDHIFQVGDETFEVGPGAFVFGPRGVPHAQRRAVPRTGRILTICTPAGLENFFRELSAADAAGTDGPAAFARISDAYGITWLEE